MLKQLRYTVLVLTMAMLAGCGNNGDNKKETSSLVGDTVTMPQEITKSCDTTPAKSSKTDETEELILHSDTAVHLEKGLFSRKQQTMYSSESLVGEWVHGTVHELYYSDNTGLQWDTKDDVSKDEAQTFYWEMKDNQLKQVYKMELGAVVPRTYTVTFVDDESLVYKDDFGTSFMWDKKE